MATGNDRKRIVLNVSRQHSTGQSSEICSNNHLTTEGNPNSMNIDISRCLKLPTLPTIAIEVLRLFDDPDASIDQITDVIRKDPAITSPLLKAANSSQYGGRGSTSDVKRAAIMLGRNSVAPLVLSFSLANQSTSDGEHGNYFRQFWLRSFVQATASELLGSYFGSPVLKAESYTISLLSGAGKLAMLRAESERYIPLLEKAEKGGLSLTDLELEEFGLTHHKMSSVMLGQIGLPHRCISAIASLDHSSRGLAIEDEIELRLIKITRTANCVASLLCDGRHAVSIVELEDALEELQLPTDIDSQDLLSMIQDRIEATAHLFDIDSSKIPPVTDILQDALEQLSQISVLASQPNSAEQVPDALLQENGRLKKRVDDLLRASRVDVLTNVFNRGYLLSQLPERAAVHRIRKQPLGIGVVDIDHFKKVNDTHGHQAGDHVLKQVAACLQKCIRDVDFLARYGGEEFVVILENVDTRILQIVGERMRSAVEALRVEFADKVIPVTISIGFCESLVTDDEQSHCDRMFAAADAAMYEAKNSGRNQFRIFGTNMLDKDSLPASACSQPRMTRTRESLSMT